MVERGSTNKQYILFTNSNTITFCVRHIPIVFPVLVLCSIISVAQILVLSV